MNFHGVVIFADRPSDRPPSGAKGHKILLTREAVEAALPRLIGKAVTARCDWSGHDNERVIGYISEAGLAGDEVIVRGSLFQFNHPQIIDRIQASEDGELGMSADMKNSHVEDLRAEVYRITKVTFTGAAIILREKAAYRQTRFSIQEEQ